MRRARRADFDSGLLPSVAGKVDAGAHAGQPYDSEPRTKWLRKAWETAGWDERAGPSGRLEYVYKEGLRRKQRKAQPSQSVRAAVRRRLD